MNESFPSVESTEREPLKTPETTMDTVHNREQFEAALEQVERISDLITEHAADFLDENIPVAERKDGAASELEAFAKEFRKKYSPEEQNKNKLFHLLIRSTFGPKEKPRDPDEPLSESELDVVNFVSRIAEKYKFDAE